MVCSKEHSCNWTKTCLFSCTTTRPWCDLIWNTVIWFGIGWLYSKLREGQPDFWGSVRRRATQKDCSTWNYTSWKGEGWDVRGDLIEMYMIFNNPDVIKFQNLFPLAKSDKTTNAEGTIKLNTAILTVNNIHLVY